MAHGFDYCAKHDKHMARYSRCYACIVDDMPTVNCMTKPAVEALVREMLRGVERRMDNLHEGMRSCVIVSDRVRFIDEQINGLSGRVSDLEQDPERPCNRRPDISETHPVEVVVTKAELERLRRIESQVNVALNYMHHDYSDHSECPVCILQQAAGHRS